MLKKYIFVSCIPKKGQVACVVEGPWQPDLLVQLGGLPPETAATAFCPAASPQPDFVPLKDLLDAYPAAGTIFRRLPETDGLPPILALLGQERELEALEALLALCLRRIDSLRPGVIKGLLLCLSPISGSAGNSI